MSVFKNLFSIGFLGEVAGRITIKIWLESYKNIVERPSAARNFHYTNEDSKAVSTNKLAQKNVLMTLVIDLNIF